MPRLNNDQVSTSLWFAGGGLIAWGSVEHGVGTLAAPGTGFITLLAGLGICFFSLIGLIAATIESRKGSGWKPVMKGLEWQKSFLVMATLPGRP